MEIAEANGIIPRSAGNVSTALYQTARQKKLKRDGMTVKLPETPIFRNMNHTLKMKAAGR